MVSDKTIYKAFWVHKILYTKPMRDFFSSHYLPKLYIGFKTVLVYILCLTQTIIIFVVLKPMCLNFNK